MSKGARNRKLRIENSHQPTMDDAAAVYETEKRKLMSMVTTINLVDILTMTEDTAADVLGWLPDGRWIYQIGIDEDTLPELIAAFKHNAMVVLMLGASVQMCAYGQYGYDTVDRLSTVIAHKMTEPLVKELLEGLDEDEQ